MKKILRILTYAILIASLMLLLAVLLVPRFTGLKLDPVVSGSMEPAIKTGALIAIAKVDPAQIQVGDIIGFRVPGIDTPVCHRIIDIVSTSTGYGFRTRGDANAEPDAWVVSPYDVIGKVYFTTSFLLPAAKLMMTPSGFVLLMLLPALTVIGLEVRAISLRGKKHKPGEAPGLPSKVE